MFTNEFSDIVSKTEEIEKLTEERSKIVSSIIEKFNLNPGVKHRVKLRYAEKDNQDRELELINNNFIQISTIGFSKEGFPIVFIELSYWFKSEDQKINVLGNESIISTDIEEQLKEGLSFYEPKDYE